MSPSDFGEILKPFLFLDLLDHEGASFNGPLHPHSGIVTLTYVAEGAGQHQGTLPAGGVEWMQAGRGMWHGGGFDKAGRRKSRVIKRPHCPSDRGPARPCRVGSFISRPSSARILDLLQQVQADLAATFTPERLEEVSTN
jgi:hypothetical protein